MAYASSEPPLCRVILSTSPYSCHPERSEGSALSASRHALRSGQARRCAPQDDRGWGQRSRKKDTTFFDLIVYTLEVRRRSALLVVLTVLIGLLVSLPADAAKPKRRRSAARATPTPKEPPPRSLTEALERAARRPPAPGGRRRLRHRRPSKRAPPRRAAAEHPSAGRGPEQDVRGARLTSSR